MMTPIHRKVYKRQRGMDSWQCPYIEKFLRDEEELTHDDTYT